MNFWKKSKYKAKPVFVDGIRFPSKKEARIYQERKSEQELGVIDDLRLQVNFPLHGPNGSKIGTYRADFVYKIVESGQKVIDDAKGFKTDIFKWKWKHLQDEYGSEYLLRLS